MRTGPHHPPKRLLLALVVVAALVPLPLAAGSGAGAEAPGDRAPRSFSDVPPTHPFFTEITWLVDEGVTEGYANGTFRPGAAITRQAMAAWLYRYRGEPAFTPPVSPTFPDVAASHPFFLEIEWAAAEGMMNGFPGGLFRPNQLITRQATAALMYRAAGEPPFTPPATPSFSDVSLSHAFFLEIEWAANQGIVEGYDNGTFKPTRSVTRQAGAAFLYRFDHLASLPAWTDPRQISFATAGALLSDLTSAAGPDGSVHVAWKEDDQLLYRKLDRAGNSLSRTVNLGADHVQPRAYARSDIALAPLADGGVIVFWRYSVGKPEQPGVYAMRIDAGGRVLGDETLVAPGFHSYLSAATDGDGYVHLLALENQTSTEYVNSSHASHRIWALRMHDDLTPASPSILLADRIRNNATNYPRIAVEDDGTVHVVWFDARRYAAGTNRYDVYYARWGGPDPAIAPFQLSDDADGYVVTPDLVNFEVGPAVDVAADGTVQIAWLNLNDVHLATVHPDGAAGLRGVIHDLGDPAAFRNDALGVHAEPDGDMTVVVASGSDDHPVLVQARFATDGTLVNGPTSLPTGSGAWTYPSLTAAGGELQVVVRDGTTSHRLYVLTTSTDTPVNLPDLLVDDAHSTNTAAHTPAREGDTVHVTLEATNGGLVPAPATTAEVRYQGDLVATVPVPALGQEQVATIAADWTVPAAIAVDPALLTVTVDPGDGIAETSEANNSVEHQVLIGLRPDGIRVPIVAWDETLDPTRAGFEGAYGATVTLSGTTTEGGDPFTTSGTATAYSGAIVLDDIVPPGTYTLTGSDAGYQLSGTTAVTVTRDPGDPYVITVDPPAPVGLWFNRWGTIDGTVTTGGSPLAGAKVVESPQGIETTTAADGTYTLPDMASGDHTVTISADGYERQLGAPVTVVTTETATVNASLAVATTGYVDAVATNQSGVPVNGALIELRDSTGATVIDSCTAGADGRCSFEPSAGVTYRVSATANGYSSGVSAAVAVVAGRQHPVALELELNIGSVTDAGSGFVSWSSWVEHYCFLRLWGVCIGQNLWTLYGNFGTEFDMEYQDVGADRMVRSLSVNLDSNSFLFTLTSYGGLPGGGPGAISATLADNYEEQTNVRVDAIRLVDRETKDVFWQQVGPGLAYSGGGTGAAGWRPDAAVDWTKLAVELDVTIGQWVPGETGPAGWEGSPILQGYRTDQSRVTWIPSTNQTVIAARIG